MGDQNIRIVIAEDDFLVCEEVKRILRGSRYTIVGEACNGEELVKMASDLNPDLILMDIKMPKIDGLEASRQITEQHPLPIVILTAYESSELVEQASKVGVGAFLGKPPQFVEIDRAITIAMARHNDLMEVYRLNKELEKALEEIKTLEGILPLCSYCKKIRNTNGNWEEVDVYTHEHSEADISHSIGKDCMKQHYPEEYEAICRKMD